MTRISLPMRVLFSTLTLHVARSKILTMSHGGTNFPWPIEVESFKRRSPADQ